MNGIPWSCRRSSVYASAQATNSLSRYEYRDSPQFSLVRGCRHFSILDQSDPITLNPSRAKTGQVPNLENDIKKTAKGYIMYCRKRKIENQVKCSQSCRTYLLAQGTTYYKEVPNVGTTAHFPLLSAFINYSNTYPERQSAQPAAKSKASAHPTEPEYPLPTRSSPQKMFGFPLLPQN
jgi:hypothetical protein